MNIEGFDKANYEHLASNLKARRYSSALFPSVDVLMTLAVALVVIVGGGMVVWESLGVGVVVAFVLYIERLFEPVSQLASQFEQLQKAMVSADRIFELLDIELDVPDDPDAMELSEARGEVGYHGVSFGYERESMVLQDVDLQIGAGETVALVGPTGAGKTTLVSLLMRLYDVTEGRITVDGHDIRRVSLASLARQVSIVPQEPFLFTGTVKENIRYNHVEAADDVVVRAAKAVGAHEFISELEQSYETLLEERGGNLSVGQRQLISFARALVADPMILILDEATAYVDTETEMLIQQALRELLRDRTAIVIAHRLSTVRNADRILVLDQGRVVEQGSHQDLMASPGLYARLQSFTTAEA